jgi:ABC-2 type transport system permease protein
MRSRVGAFFAIAFPIILILLFGAIFSGGGSQKVPIYVQDLSDSPMSHNFTAALSATTVLDVRAVPKGIAILEYIRQNSINTALLIPADFQTKILANETVNVILYGDPTQSSYGIAYAAVNGAATQFNFAVARARPIVLPETQKIVARDLRFIDLFLPGVIGLTVLTNPLFGMTSVCAEYRTRKFFKFLATTRLSKGEWLASKIIWYSFLMLVSTAIMFVVERLVFGGSAVITPVAILLIIAGTFEFTSLGMILGLYVRDTETAAAVANAIGFPMMFLGGSFFPVDTMPPAIQAIARVLPLTYVNEGLRATMVFGNDATALLYLGITLVIGAVLFVIPAKALSWKSK